MTVLVVTNDFPPRQGGIETFVRSLCDELPNVVVYTSHSPGDTSYDAGLPFPVVRDRTTMLLPTPRITKHAVRLMREHDADRVLFGAAAPLGLMGPALRRAGARRIVAMTHGHETWWAGLPGTRQALRRIGEAADTVTTVSSWCAEQIAPALSPAAVRRMRRLTPGVDTDRFFPECGGEQVRKGLGLEVVPVVACVSRLIPRKGQDTLIRAWPRVWPPNPQPSSCWSAAVRTANGWKVSRPPSASPRRWSSPARCRGRTSRRTSMPRTCSRCRAGRGGSGSSRRRSGSSTLEASAAGKPVVIGDSGGAADTVRHGETGYLVDPYNPPAVAARLIDLLTQPAKAKTMGAAGRAWVRESWSWSGSGAVLRELLDV